MSTKKCDGGHLCGGAYNLISIDDPLCGDVRFANPPREGPKSDWDRGKIYCESCAKKNGKVRSLGFPQEKLDILAKESHGDKIIMRHMIENQAMYLRNCFATSQNVPSGFKEAREEQHGVRHQAQHDQYILEAQIRSGSAGNVDSASLIAIVKDQQQLINLLIRGKESGADTVDAI